jgi:hypothetical protein
VPVYRPAVVVESSFFKENEMKKMKKLVFLTVLTIAATSLPTDSHAAKFCAYQYYYDAAHTQLAGYCYPKCAPYTDTTCSGEVTEYYALVDCTPGCAS